MEAKDKARLAVQNKPEVVFLALNLNDSFIGVPVVRVEIERRNELYGHVLEHGGEVGTPVADGSVGHLDIHHSTQNQSDIAERVLAQVEHAQGHEDHMNRIAHPLEIRLAKEFGHGRRRNSSRLWYEHGMVALLVAAAVVAVMLHIVVQEGCLAANGARGIFFRSGASNFSTCFRCPLIPTLLTTVFLMPMRIFSVAIKVRFVVALRAAYLIQFCHEDSSPFGRYVDLW